MHEVISSVLIALVMFFLGAFTGCELGKDYGRIEYHQGKIECVEVFDEIECRLKSPNKGLGDYYERSSY